MPMSPRLLRPIASGVHPEAAAWRSAVVANGGSVSASTMKAVSKFCGDIDAAGIRDRFYRLNLFCGNSDASLIAPRVPLYRGPSRTGTQYGNVLDTNSNFVQGDYAETGASGGLNAPTANRHLNTGFATDILAAGDRHLAFYASTWPNATFRDFMGSEGVAFGGAQQFCLGHQVNADKVDFRFGSASSRISSSVISGGAFWVGTSDTTTTGRLLRNGVFETSGTLVAATPEATSVFVFAVNRASTAAPSSNFNGRSGGYSIGSHLTDAQVALYNTAMQAFQTALGRNV